MNYFNDKVPMASKYNPVPLAEAQSSWILELQQELRKAGRQVDRLERKLLLRSQKLGEARAAAEYWNAKLAEAALASIPAGYDFADNARERELEYHLQQAEREIDYLRRDGEYR